MRHKLKKVGRTLCCLILVLSMTAPSLTSFAWGTDESSSGGTGSDNSDVKDAMDTMKGAWNSMKSGSSTSSTDPMSASEVQSATNGTKRYTRNDEGAHDHGGAVVISLMDVTNSSKPYQTEITEHNTGDNSNSVWSEMSVSIVDQYLNDYPLDQIKTDTLVNSVTMLTQRSSTRTLYAYDLNNGSIEKFNNVYAADGTTETKSFDGFNIIREDVEANSVLYNKFKDKSLDVTTVRGLVASNSSKLTEWKNKFISLWDSERMGSADDILNGMFKTADSAENEKSVYYDNCLKYLDLMIVVASLANDYDKFWESIGKYLERLNQDGSDSFVTIAAVSAATLSTSENGYYFVMPLPTYLSYCTGRDVSAFSHIERDGSTGSPVKPNDSSISYDSNPNAYVKDISAKYDSLSDNYVKPACNSLYNARSSMWWVSTTSQYALALLPTDLNGKTTGNCSYTFLAAEATSIVIPPQDVVKKDFLYL